ncbi:exonuclease domain-containing protein [Salinibacterium sp. M195]|uniref:exonuclease domain-containing protein n=1 Tax=Salinibacterium sp. M195 TaxID=2583374 RepID=UPI001C62FFE5|nr:exonuclease domain-containing protein [Salinibacterium sp. M195]QYH36193.1 3'-5' exonuclease [Salinibacterium sp. M195]
MNNSGNLATFDLETTGVDVETSRIVSACIAVVDASGTVVSRWDWLADPGVDIPAGASAIHGITTERARAEGRAAAVVVAEIAEKLTETCALGIPLVVYNAPYDLSLLDRECRRYSVDGFREPYVVIDPLVIDKAVDRYRRGKRTLEVTSGFYGVALDDAHDAGSDAIAAARVAQALLAKFADKLGTSYSELHDRQRTWYADQAASFQDYIRSSKGDQSFVANDEWPVRAVPPQ